jgi:hypothetical protein
MTQVQLNSIKEFMNQLLRLDYFDDFLCVTGEITTFNVFSIDGFIHKDYYQDDSNLTHLEYSTWADLKEYCHTIIKGKQAPLSLKFVFKLPDTAIDSFIEKYNLDWDKEDIQGLYLNIRFEKQQLFITTGTTLKTFSLSKDIENAWDKELMAIMEDLNMDYETEI